MFRNITNISTPIANTYERPVAFRARYQIGLAITLAIILPMVIRYLAIGTELTEETLFNTAVGGAVALILGYTSYKRLHVFPGISSGGYIITAFTVSFALLATMLIMLRIDYSRMQLLSSYLLTLATFIIIHVRVESARIVRLGVIGAEEIGELPNFPQIIWHPIASAESPTPVLAGVIADLTADHSDAWSNRIAAFALAGTPVYPVKQALEQLSGRVEIAHLSENTLGALNPNALYLKIKMIVDTVSAALLIAALSPVIVAVAIAIRLDSPGPALFRQKRTGFRAEPFTVLKFRTMYFDETPKRADDARNSAMTLENDPRITRVGAFLRKTRLDELPQLFNVIRGEMSLIGPRPEAIALTKWYESEIPFYHYRHIIKPGLTGWAQVNQGHVTDVSDIRSKLHLDFYYVKNFSFWLDILITLKTIRIVLTGDGAK